MINRLTYKNQLVSALAFNAVVILSLLWALLGALEMSGLAISSLLLGAAYLLAWLSYRAYKKIYTPLTSLVAYGEMVSDGERNLELQFADLGSPHQALADRLKALSSVDGDRRLLSQQSDLLIANVLMHAQEPLALFNADAELVYFNAFMEKALERTLFRGLTALEIGFSLRQGRYTHPALDEDWSVNTLFYGTGNSEVLISARDISGPLQQMRTRSQADLIRILSHELNNGLTPLASLADTLLCAATLEEQQVRRVLSRIKARSESLLAFMQGYSDLSRRPKAVPRWFDLRALFESNAAEQGVELDYSGEHKCFADPVLIEQLVANLLKNSKEAMANTQATHVRVQSYHRETDQIIRVCDNGPGFSNLSNALNPLYTTKVSGQGLGLAVCQDIALRHHGHVELANAEGACVTLTLPLSKQA